jgi:hypothetical protein
MSPMSCASSRTHRGSAPRAPAPTSPPASAPCPHPAASRSAPTSSARPTTVITPLGRHVKRTAAGFLQDNATSGDYFLIAEDDITFDLVSFWPGPLSELLNIATASHPEWQIINLAPASRRNVTPWIMRSYFHDYDLDGGRQQLYFGAILYAIKKSDELAE